MQSHVTHCSSSQITVRAGEQRQQEARRSREEEKTEQLNFKICQKKFKLINKLKDNAKIEADLVQRCIG